MIAGLFCENVFSFVRNWNSLSQWLYYFAFPPKNESSSCSTSFPAFGIARFLDFSSCNRYPVVSHCYLQFPNSMWSWAHFYVLIYHLYIFGEVSAHIFGPFFFLIGLFVFSPLNFKSYFFFLLAISPILYMLYLFWRRHLSGVCLADIFSSSVVVFSFSWHCFTASLWGFLIFIFIYLAVPGLGCNMWDLVPWPGIKTELPALGAES